MKKLDSGISRSLVASLSIVMFLALAVSAHAQFEAMGVPIPTTMVITKPAPGQIFGDSQTVTMGVGAKTYKIRWPDVWQLVRQHRPNFNVTGLGEDVFAKLQPGQTMTVHGVFAPLNWNFEVIGTEEGAGHFAPAQHY